MRSTSPRHKPTVKDLSRYYAAKLCCGISIAKFCETWRIKYAEMRDMIREDADNG